MNRVFASLGAAALLAGCHPHKTPSPLFTEAANEFNHLYAQELDQAFVDPRMAAVEAKLRQVPSDSLDAKGANDLLQRIETGRAQVLADQQRQKTAAAEALAPPAAPSFGDESPAEPQAEPDAGDTGPSQPIAGMSRKDFEAHFLGCFASQGPIDVLDAGTAEMFALKGDADCQKRFGWFDQRVVLVTPTTVLGFGLKSTLRAPPGVDAGAPVAVDAGGP